MASGETPSCSASGASANMPTFYQAYSTIFEYVGIKGGTDTLEFKCLQKGCGKTIAAHAKTGANLKMHLTVSEFLLFCSMHEDMIDIL